MLMWLQDLYTIVFSTVECGCWYRSVTKRWWQARRWFEMPRIAFYHNRVISSLRRVEDIPVLQPLHMATLTVTWSPAARFVM